MMIKRSIYALLTLLISCSTSHEEHPREGIRICFPSDPTTLDPRKGGDGISSFVHYILFEGLTKPSPHTTADLSLAKQVDVSHDKLTYTFHLKEAYWSDGEPISAFDFEYSWKSMLEPDFPSPNAHLLYLIQNAKEAKHGTKSAHEIGVRSLNKTTLEVRLEKPTPYFLEVVAFCALFPIPSHIVKNDSKWALGSTSSLVSNGPYTLSTWQRGREIVAKKNTAYCNAENINVPEIKISIIDNDQSALHLFEKGELDIIGNLFANFPSDSIPHLRKNKNFHSTPIAASTFCTINVSHPFLKNRHIRHSLSLAIDRVALIENVTLGDEKVATGIIPPTLKEGMSVPFFTNNDTFLARVNFYKGLSELKQSQDTIPPLRIIYPNFGSFPRIALVLQQQWQTILGCPVEIQKVDFASYIKLLSNHEYEIAIFGWSAQYFDQMNLLDRFCYKDNPKNYPGYENSEYVDLINTSHYAASLQERKVILEKAEALLTNDMPIIPLYHWNAFHLIADRCKGIYFSHIGTCHFDRAYIVEEKSP